MDRRTFLSTGLASIASLKAGMASPVYASPRAETLTDSTLPLMPARCAEDLCASFLVNTKIFYKDSVYGHTDAVIDLLKELGTRAVRERVITGTSGGARNQQYAMPRLANAGTRWHGTICNLEDWSNATTANKAVIDFLASYYAPKVGGNLATLMRSLGGCNEIDNARHGREWGKHARIMQTALWNQAKANPRTRGIPLAGPSTRTDYTLSRAAELGDLSAISEIGALHYYNQGTSPTRGISERISISRRNFPQATQWVVVETGYNNSPQSDLGKTLPEAASATYVIRGICDFFRRRAVYGRFELLDDPDVIDYTSQTTINRTAEREAHFGLVAMTKGTVGAATPDTWRKKPEFYATQRFLSLLSDRGPAFTPAGLHLKVAGGSSDLQQLLVQKRSGKHYLMLWRDVEVSTLYPNPKKLDVKPYRVTVQFSPRRAVSVFEPGRTAQPVYSQLLTGSVTVPLAGELKVVAIG